MSTSINATALPAARVIVIGERECGSSRLISRITSSCDIDQNRKRPNEIEVASWAVQLPRPNGAGTLDMTLSVWDFSDREIRYATHQFFMSKRSLYIIVANARVSEERNRLAYWLKMVKRCGGDSPTVLGVNTIDVDNQAVDESRLRTDWLDRRVHCVSFVTGDGIDALRADILAHVARLPHVFDELPATYFNVRAQLQKWVEDNSNYIDYATYERICRSKDLADKAGQERLIRLLHDLGVVLHFDDPDSPYSLADTVVLNRDWITSGVYLIINDNDLSQEKGRLTRSHLERILPESKYPDDKRQYLVRVMHKFEQCYEYADEPGCWLVPETLSKIEPKLDWKESESLNFRYLYDVHPGGLIGRFIVRTYRYHQSSLMRWRSGVQLDIDGHTVFVREDLGRRMIFITVQGPRYGRQRALAVVRHILDDIHAALGLTIVTQLVPLYDRLDYHIPYDLVRLREKHYEERIRLPGMDREYSIQDLLNGVIDPESRARQIGVLDHLLKYLRKAQLLLAPILEILTGIGACIFAIRRWFTGLPHP